MSIDILIVDDEKDIRLLIKGILEDEGYTVREAANVDQTKAAFEDSKPNLVILDIWLEGSSKDGLEILEDLKAEHKHLPVLMISGHGTIETAVNAIKKGAYDFIEKPFKSDRLILMIRRALETASLKKENETLKAKAQIESEFIGESEAIQKVRSSLEKAADTNSRVLITGEPGTGKNVAIRFLHNLSKRKDKPLHTVSCANLHPDRFEYELFGSEAGDTVHHGAIEQAKGGTLYLDEVGDMPLETQGKIVRALQEEKFKRLCGEEEIPLNVRIVSSTNKNLEDEIKQGNFREDLYYRLNVVPVKIPSLRERLQDIPALAQHFIGQCAKQSDLRPLMLSEEAAKNLKAFHWPGNARQLKNMIEWILIMHSASTDTVEEDHLPPELTGGKSITPSLSTPANDFIALSLKEAREAFERHYLQSQLSRFEGNISKTAEFIGMERSALHRKMKSLDISPSAKQDGKQDDSQKETKRA